MRRLILLLVLCVNISGVKGQIPGIYKNNLPEHVEKRPKGLIRISRDSIILQSDVAIGKFRKVLTDKKGKTEIRYYIFQNNGKPIGDIFLKTPGKAIAYSDKDGVETKIQYSTVIDEFEMLVFLLNYYIKGGYL